MPNYFSIKGRLLRELLAKRGSTIARMIGPRALEDLSIVRGTRDLAPLLVQDAAALEILACVRAVSHLGGAMAEAGVYAGGTARLICQAKESAALHLFDVFETLQMAKSPATPRADELRRAFGAFHTPRAAVERLLSPYPGVHLHVGVFPDSTRGLEGERFSFVHIDLDLEPSTRDALKFFYPRLLPGGIIIGDDYNDTAVRRAFDLFFADRADTLIERPWGQVVVIKSREIS